jgi:uncharacterized protein (TIGR03083 family)
MGPIAVTLGARPPGELLDRLRAASGGRFVVPGASPMIALGEVVTHGLDITRPLGLPDTVAPERMAGVLTTYRSTGFAFGTGRRARRVTLVPAETDVRIGEGPAVTGPAGDLVLALAGRAPAPGALGGPGLPLLLPGATRVRS